MSLKLLKVREDDLELIMNWRMKPEVTRFMYTDPKLTIEGQRHWLNKVKEDNKSRYWTISYDNVRIGLLSITEIDLINKKCSWAYYIGDDSFRGKGIATSLECNIYEYVFNELSLNKLCCEVFSFNEKVVSIHKKFGSEVEGILKDHINKNNEFYDVVVMGITKAKWNSIKENYNFEKIEIE